MKRALIYSAACAAVFSTAPVTANPPIYIPVFKKLPGRMGNCVQLQVDAFTARQLTARPDFQGGHCVDNGYPISAPVPPVMVATPGGQASGRVFTKVPRDEMYDEDDDDLFQGAGAPTRPGLPIFGGDDDDFMQGPGNASPFGPFGGDDDDDINVGKVKGIVDKFKKIKGMFDKNDDDDEEVGWFGRNHCLNKCYESTNGLNCKSRCRNRRL